MPTNNQPTGNTMAAHGSGGDIKFRFSPSVIQGLKNDIAALESGAYKSYSYPKLCSLLTMLGTPCSRLDSYAVREAVDELVRKHKEIHAPAVGTD